MIVEYHLDVAARCPVNEGTDVYQLTVTSEEMITVELILAEVGRFTREPIFQEDLTEQLAEALGATVQTVGFHSNVETVCTVEP